MLVWFTGSSGPPQTPLTPTELARLADIAANFSNGDLLWYNAATGHLEALHAGTSGQLLATGGASPDGTPPAWQTVAPLIAWGNYSSVSTIAFPTNGTPAVLGFTVNDEVHGTAIAHSTSVNTSRFTATVACDVLALFQPQISRTAPSANDAIVWIRKNGANVANSAARLRLTTLNDNAVLPIGVTVRMAVNDYIELAYTCEDNQAGRYAMVNTAASGSIPQTPACVAALFAYGVVP